MNDLAYESTNNLARESQCVRTCVLCSICLRPSFLCMPTHPPRADEKEPAAEQAVHSVVAGYEPHLSKEPHLLRVDSDQAPLLVKCIFRFLMHSNLMREFKAHGIRLHTPRYPALVHRIHLRHHRSPQYWNLRKRSLPRCGIPPLLLHQSSQKLAPRQYSCRVPLPNPITHPQLIPLSTFAGLAAGPEELEASNRKDRNNHSLFPTDNDCMILHEGM